jgi:hypothetical protein
MLASTKQATIAIAATLVLSTPLAPAFSTSDPSNTAMQNQAAPSLRIGNLVRLRSGGGIAPGNVEIGGAALLALSR